MRGTSWNKEVHGKDLVCAIHNLGMITKRAARNRTSPDRYHNLGIRDCLVGLLESQAHVLSDGTSDQKSVSMPRRRHKLNPEPAEIEHYGIQNVDIRLASIASARADLSEFERPPKDAVGLCSKPPGEAQGIAFSQDQIVSLTCRKWVLRGKLDRSFGTCVGTLWTEQTATKIEPQASVLGDRVGRASIYATRTTRRTPGLVDCRKPTKSLRQNWLDLRKW